MNEKTTVIPTETFSEHLYFNVLLKLRCVVCEAQGEVSHN